MSNIELTDEEINGIIRTSKTFTPSYQLNPQTDFKCKSPAKLTLEQINEITKNAKTFIPPGDAGSYHHNTKPKCPTDFKCEPINLTVEEIIEIRKTAEVYISRDNYEGIHQIK
jgi:hypothetical protein